jgi:hypothetical protein
MMPYALFQISHHYLFPYSSSSSLQPCDLYTNSSFTYNYENIPDLDGFDISLAPAPRFDLATYEAKPVCIGEHGTLQDRIQEYDKLYGVSLPDKSWWGWNLWETSYREFKLKSEVGRQLRETDD